MQFVSCRPRDVRAEDKIDELITAAAARTEPMELVPQSFLPSFPRVSDESRAEKVQTYRTRRQIAYIYIYIYIYIYVDGCSDEQGF